MTAPIPVSEGSPPLPEGVELDRYDTGLLGDGGGGDIEWWQDYIRAELDRAHEFYQDQARALPASVPPETMGFCERCHSFLPLVHGLCRRHRSPMPPNLARLIASCREQAEAMGVAGHNRARMALIEAAERLTARPSSVPGEVRSLAIALRVANDGCSGVEPSLSVLQRTADQAADMLERLSSVSDRVAILEEAAKVAEGYRRFSYDAEAVKVFVQTAEDIAMGIRSLKGSSVDRGERP